MAPFARALVVAAALSAGAVSSVPASEPLPALTIDLARTSVSGLSSGAYMAGQFHVAFSSTVTGAGIVAGGPYGCAEGRLALALNRCMATTLGVPDPGSLLARARDLAAADAVDPLANLADDRVYLFSGAADRTVSTAVTASAAEFYRLAGVPSTDIRFDAAVEAGHGFLVEEGPVPCRDTAPPFVNDCDLDQARIVLEHLHGPLAAPAEDVATPTAFDQTVYLADPEAKGMATAGWVYVPETCARGETCRVHVAFHGCRQSVARVGDAFVVGAGFNRWAEANRIVMLYPQAHEAPGNPNACWDWWGYTGARYATREGVQMAAVHRMLLALAGGGSDGSEPFCARHEGWNWSHWLAGRAVPCGFGFACAAGSGDSLGTFLQSSRVYEHPRGFYTAEPCGG